MSGPQNLNDLKAKVSALKTEVDAITQTEWENYVKIRDILAKADELVLGGGDEAATGGAEFAAAGGSGGAMHGSFTARVVRCAMLGIHEPGQGTASEYDAGAVERFAHLGG